MDSSNNNSNETPFAAPDSSYLKALNKASLKITKPTRKPFLPDPNPLPQTQQPPVYNINKNDFRDVVQKLTGSPAHDRSTVPNNNIQSSTRPSSSRLQRIRPPPLIQIRPQNDTLPNSSFLPPLPSVHHAAESPISAYMRVFQNSMGPTNGNDVAVVEKESPISTYMRFLQNSVYSRDSPRQQMQMNNNNNNQMMEQGSIGNLNSEANNSMFPVMPVSPLPFGGCVPSPRSQYGILGSPGLLFSPTSGMPQLPLSPLPSPRWKGV